MSIWTLQSIRYVSQQPTSTPSGYQQTAALPDAASSIARNGIWPSSVPFPVVTVPVDGRIEKPIDAPEIRIGQPG